MRMPAADLLPGDRIVRSPEQIVTVKAKLPSRTRSRGTILRFVAEYNGREGIIEYTERASIEVTYT